MNETTTRTATTVWIGSTGKGRGELLVGSDAFPAQQLSLPGRLNNTPNHQTSPEELLAAAHSACLAMAVSAGLTAARHAPEHVRVDAACELGKTDTGGYRITRMSLNVSAAVPGIEDEEFNRIVDAAALSCPISQALIRNVEIDVDQQLE
jgi:osmotically inducible protein OsmC